MIHCWLTALEGDNFVQETLRLIQTHLDKGTFANEAAISQQAVKPVLAELGWAIFDPEEVVHEYTTASGRVDYALCIRGSPRIFVEVKQAGTFQRGVEQLLKYAYAEGIEMAVLTDGQRWSFYLSLEPVPFQERRVELLDIVDRHEDKAAFVLLRYLKRDAVQSGANVKAAREDLRSATRRTKAAANIPSAWASLLEETDGLIAQCLAERVEENTGVAPAEQDVQDYLDRVARIPRGSKPASTPVQGAAPPTAQPSLRSVASSASQVFEASAQSSLHNVRHSATTNEYRRRWLAFANWCESNGHPWLPANPEHIAGWLEANWPRLTAGSLTADLAAIRLVHEAHGKPNPVGRGSLARQCLANLKQRESASGNSDQSSS